MTVVPHIVFLSIKGKKKKQMKQYPQLIVEKKHHINPSIMLGYQNQASNTL